jgi:hypothetical protein
VSDVNIASPSPGELHVGVFVGGAFVLFLIAPPMNLSTRFPNQVCVLYGPSVESFGSWATRFRKTSPKARLGCDTYFQSRLVFIVGGVTLKGKAMPHGSAQIMQKLLSTIRQESTPPKTLPHNRTSNLNQTNLNVCVADYSGLGCVLGSYVVYY